MQNEGDFSMLKPVELKGEQKKVLFLPPKNPIQIRGVAGSGKTTVAIYRAKHLLENYADLFRSDPYVCIFTYNKSLVRYINNLLPHVKGGYKQSERSITSQIIKPGLRVNVTNFHKWAYHFLEQHGISLRDKIIKEYRKISIIDSCVAQLRRQYPKTSVLRKSSKFFSQEFSWMKGKILLNESDYIEAERIGRGRKDRVTKKDKEIIFSCFLKYQNRLNQLNQYDFDDFALLCLTAINENGIDEPFTHIVVDEAQDLTKAQILVLYNLIDKNTDSITFIADAAQRIYKSGLTWSEVGINVRGGRSVELKRNYRNTVQIIRAAMSLLDHEDEKEEFTELEMVERNGDKPFIGYFDNFNDQLKYLMRLLTEIDFHNFSVAVLHRRTGKSEILKQHFLNEGFKAEIIKDSSFIDFHNDKIKISTMSSIKGLEFDYVFIIDLNDDIFPHPDGFADKNDDFHISTERRLLYTSMTRAKEKLFLFSSGKPSRFLAEIDDSLVEVVKKNHLSQLSMNNNYDDVPF